MPGSWIDAHCHLADLRFDESLEEVIARSRVAGVGAWVQGGVGPTDWQRQTELRARFGNAIRPTFGLHPWWVSARDNDALETGLRELEARLVATPTVALGELGIDRGKKWRAAQSRQERAFEAQLDLARRLERRLVLHVVRAHARVIEVLRRSGPHRGGLVHSFSGTVDDGLAYIELGFHLSLNGAFLADKARAATRAALPLASIVVETDAPDQRPAGAATALNESSHLPMIADALAPSWDTSGEDLLDRSRDVLDSLFPADGHGMPAR